MQIEQLEYLVEVAKTGTIYTAAQNLNVSQSAISQSISSLERELGVTIFKRSRKGSMPTDEGKKVIKKAHEILIKVQELKDEVQQDMMLISGELKLSSIPPFMKFLVKPLTEFKNDYPGVNIEITEKNTQDIINDVRQNDIDMGLITFHKGLMDITENLDFEPFIEGEMKVYVNKNSPLAVYDTVTPQELLNQTIVIYNGDYVKWFVDDFISKFGPLNILFTSNNTDVLRKAISEGLAITFSPDWSTNNNRQILNKRVKIVQIMNLNSVNVSFGLVQPKNKKISATAKKFVNYLKRELGNSNLSNE